MEDCWITIMNECMYHRDGNFDADYGAMSVDEMLEIMEIFVRHTHAYQERRNGVPL